MHQDETILILSADFDQILIKLIRAQLIYQAISSSLMRIELSIFYCLIYRNKD